MKKILFVLLLFLAKVGHAQTTSCIIDPGFFTADTGICSVNIPVHFQFNFSAFSAYAGIRYQWKLDFGDSTTVATGRDTTHYSVEELKHDIVHVYLSAGKRNVKLYLLDSAGSYIDSSTQSYKVGSCYKGGGIVYCDGNPNCKYDVGEAVYGNWYTSFSRNGVPEYRILDSNSSFSIPVFDSDYIVQYPANFNCNAYSITPSNLHQDFPKSLAEYGYFDTVVVPKHICAGKYGTFRYKGMHIPNSAYNGGGTGPDHEVGYWLGDGSQFSGYFTCPSGSDEVPYHFVFDHPGDFTVTFELYYQYKIQWRQTQKVHVENCEPVKLDMYYDFNNNCVKDAGEPPVDTAVIYTQANLMGTDQYYSDTNGHINMLMYPGDTLRFDSVARYFAWPNEFDAHRNDVCAPSYITDIDTIVQLPFIPGYVSGYTFTDKNNNCLIDSTERGFAGQLVETLLSGITRSATQTDADGFYRLPLIPRKVYDLKVSGPAINLVSSCATNPISITSYGDTVTQNFAYSCVNTNDIGVTVYHNSAVSNSIDTMYVDVTNSACVPGTTILTVDLDPKAIFLYSSTKPNNIVGNLLSYNISDTFARLPVKIAYRVPGNNGNEVLLCNGARVTAPVTDPDTTNNIAFFCDSIYTSQPGFIKSMSIVGDTTGSFSLLYTLRVENRDSLDINNLDILDTLDSGLDWSTVSLYACSQPVHLLRKNNVLHFVFFNPHITSWEKDTASSYAFVAFLVRPFIPITFLINNTARFYIDTNRVFSSNVVTYPLLLPSSIPSTTSLSNRFKYYPNPVYSTLYIDNPNDELLDVTVLSIEGKLLSTVRMVKGINELSFAAFTNGSYVILIKDKLGFIVGRQLIVKEH